MKSDSVSVYEDLIPLSPYTHLHTFLLTSLHSPSCVHIKWMAYFPTKKQIRTFEYRIHRNINIRKKYIYQKINGSVR